MATPEHHYDLRDFYYHSITLEVAARMTEIRAQYHALAQLLVATCPTNRELSLALTHLEESLMRSIQSLAVMQGTPVPIGEVTYVADAPQKLQTTAADAPRAIGSGDVFVTDFARTTRTT